MSFDKSFDKFSMNKSPSTLSHKYNMKIDDVDPFSVVTVEDLLQGANDWRNIQEIVRLTFKSLTDIVKAQGQAIRELDRTKVTKQDLQQALQNKANNLETNNNFQRMNEQLEQKINLDDCRKFLQDYSLKQDIQYLLSTKQSTEDFKAFQDHSRQSLTDQKHIINDLSEKLQDFQKEVNNSIKGLAQIKDVAALQNQILEKADLTEVNAQLETKATKQSVTNALQRKANRVDIEQLLSRKAEITDLQVLQEAFKTKADIQQLEQVSRAVDQKLEKSEFGLIVNSLANKAERIDVEGFHNNLRAFKAESENQFRDLTQLQEQLANAIEDARFSLSSSINKKVDSIDFERVLNQLNQKVDQEHYSTTILQLKDEVYEDLSNIKNEIATQRRQFDQIILDREHQTQEGINLLKGDILQISEAQKVYSNEKKNDLEEMQKFVKNITNGLKKEIQKDTTSLADDLNRCQKMVNDLLNDQLSGQEFKDFKNKVQRQLEEKVDLQEVQNALNACQQDISQRFQEFREDTRMQLRNQSEEFNQFLSKKADSVEVNHRLNLKQDASALQNVLINKANNTELEEVRQLMDNLYQNLKSKVDINQLDANFKDTAMQLEGLQREILLKANIKDVCTLLDAKANHEDFSKFLVDIRKDVSRKANLDDLKAVINDQAIINESLCTENIIGRWTWKSGEIKQGSLIPWEIQVVNTLPDNFLWEKDKSSIILVAPGLYEISFGFFSKKKPTIQIYINGEPVISAVYTNQTGKIKDMKNSLGQIAGLTLVDFLIIPPRARLSLSYSGEFGGEGFLALKRL